MGKSRTNWIKKWGWCLGMMLMCWALTAGEALQPPQLFAPGDMTLLDEVDLGADNPGHEFASYPAANIFARQQILGKKCLVIANNQNSDRDRYIAVRLGAGKNLQAGVQYALQIEYPEDAPRSYIVRNCGNETTRGFYTGTAFGDALKMLYVFGNPESVKYPLSNKWKNATFVFELHPQYSLAPDGAGGRVNTPADGFTLIIGHFRYNNDPRSQGPAVGKIKLFALKNPAAANVALKLPPAGLPQRHLFWREEMSDGVVFDTKNPAFPRDRISEWFTAKFRLAQFLGMDTFAKDLLEFGHNQGWNSDKFGGNEWVYQSSEPGLWGQIVEVAGKMGLNILPMYEYCGSFGGKGLGPQKRCKTLSQQGKGPEGRDDYTHIHWSEKGNADVTDPDTVEDLRKMLEITIADEKAKAKFIGAWIRPRNSGMPVSFSDRCLQLFAKSKKMAKAPTRQELQKDRKLYDSYIAWWLTQRRDFLAQIRDYLRKPEVIGKEAMVLFTGDPSEPGRVLATADIVTDDASGLPSDCKSISPDKVLSQRSNWKALTEPHGTWGGWEWQHSIPQNDPLDYQKTPGVMLTQAFNRLYTVADARNMQAFTAADGLALIRHYPLNENCFYGAEQKERPLGYFVCDFEVAGPYCMLAEARALANGNPRFLGYMAANSFQRAFPEYVRAFNAAFLALPALPAETVKDATAAANVVVRKIATPKDGTWYAIINTGMQDVKGAAIKLPGKPVNYLTGKAAPAQVSLYPGQVLVWHSK